jgi:hypothetical protein
LGFHSRQGKHFSPVVCLTVPNRDLTARLCLGSKLRMREGLPGLRVFGFHSVRLTLFHRAELTCSGKVRVPSRTIAQAVSRWPPTAATRVRAQDTSSRICGGENGTGAGFLRVLGFTLPILIPPTATHSSSVIWGWYSRRISGRRAKWTQSQPTSRKKSVSPIWCILSLLLGVKDTVNSSPPTDE